MRSNPNNYQVYWSYPGFLIRDEFGEIVEEGFRTEAQANHYIEDAIEQISPTDDLLRQMSCVARELEEVTRTPEGCDNLLNDMETVFGAAICFSLATNRLKARAND